MAQLVGAQTVDNSVQLRLRFVEITPHPADPTQTLQRAGTANTSTMVPATSGTANRTRTFEVQYSLSDSAGATVPAGLVSGTLNILGGPGPTYSQALLTNLQARTGGTSPLPLGGADASGAATGPLAGAAGMERPFRGGFSSAANNADASNGSITPNTAAFNGILSIVPLTISQTLTAPITNQWFALYEFNVFFPVTFSGNYQITAAFQPDPGTGAAFGFFNDGAATPVTSTNATSATVPILVQFPAPGAAVVLGFGGLAALRRRRTPAGGW